MPETLNPATLNQALKFKARSNVLAVAGGTDLLVRLHDIIDKPWPKLLALDKIKPLHKIENKGDCIIIGPLITFTDIENSSILRRYAPQLVEAASAASSVQIRNRATIGGNIANGSPAGDLIGPLYSLDAILELSSSAGKRHVAIEEFFKGPGKTVLKHAELITAVAISKKCGQGFFLRLATRQALAISKVSISASLRFKAGKIDCLRIALGAVAPTVIRARKAEAFLLGKELSNENIATAAEISKSEAHPIDDVRSNAKYRREMVAVLLRRGLTRINETLRHGPERKNKRS